MPNRREIKEKLLRMDLDTAIGKLKEGPAFKRLIRQPPIHVDRDKELINTIKFTFYEDEVAFDDLQAEFDLNDFLEEFAVYKSLAKIIVSEGPKIFDLIFSKGISNVKEVASYLAKSLVTDYSIIIESLLPEKYVITKLEKNLFGNFINGLLELQEEVIIKRADYAVRFPQFADSNPLIKRMIACNTLTSELFNYYLIDDEDDILISSLVTYIIKGLDYAYEQAADSLDNPALEQQITELSYA